MLDLDLEDIKYIYPGIFNISPITNEVSIHSLKPPFYSYPNNEFYLDEQYGRIINKNATVAYGDDKSMNYYDIRNPDKIVDTLRVPFRKIPIWELKSIEEINNLIKIIIEENKSHTILLRGQTKLYELTREEQDCRFLYGNSTVKEPSFQPSFLRSNFNETFIHSLWHCQTALLLNDIGVDISKILTDIQRKEFYEDLNKIILSPHFTSISLGFAQHYGLPSVGLDLTKDLKVALWFATNELIINERGEAIVSQLKDFSESTLYIFRCPDDSVFSYKELKPKFIENTRPDRQDAWFSHVGWGYAKNQLASYLVCGIRLNSEFLNLFEESYSEFLFPPREVDLVLNTFLDISACKKYKGEVRRALNKIYTLKTNKCR